MNNNLFLNITSLFLTVKKRCNVQNMNTSSIHCPSAFVMFLICDQSVLSATQIYYQYAAILSKTCQNTKCHMKFILSHCNYLTHSHFVHLSINHCLLSLFSCASFSFSSSFQETPNWKYRHIKPNQCYIFFIHIILFQIDFYEFTIISKISTFCNF